MEQTSMKKIIAALIAALFAAVTFSAVAADDPPQKPPIKKSKKRYRGSPSPRRKKLQPRQRNLRPSSKFRPDVNDKAGIYSLPFFIS